MTNSGEKGESSNNLVPDRWVVDRANRLWHRMEFEVTLMSSRISWLIAGQSVFIAAFFVGEIRLSDGVGFNGLIILFIPFIALALCFLTFVYIKTGSIILGVCRDELAEIKSDFREALSDNIDEFEGASRWRTRAIWSHFVLVSLFGAFWVLVLVSVLCNLWLV